MQTPAKGSLKQKMILRAWGERPRAGAVLAVAVAIVAAMAFPLREARGSDAPPPNKAEASQAVGPEAPPPNKADGSLAKSIFKNTNALNPKRHVALPKLRVWQAKNDRKTKGDKNDDAPFDYGRYRFSVLLALATWSEKAKETAAFFKKNQGTLQERKIGLVGIFTHDSYEDVGLLAKQEGYDFLIAKPDLQFVTELLNPKVPTIWIADHTGQVIYRLVRPTPEGVEEAYRLLLAWTDF